MSDTQQRCITCREWKGLSSFGKDGRASSGLRSMCRGCVRAYNKKRYASDAGKAANANSRLKKLYGLSLKEYETLLATQGGACAICGRTGPGCTTMKRLLVDHCHLSGKVRGLLCFNCNTALGKLNDDADLLRRAIQYLSASGIMWKEATGP